LKTSAGAARGYIPRHDDHVEEIGFPDPELNRRAPFK
jgi:hypothetical protein